MVEPHTAKDLYYAALDNFQTAARDPSTPEAKLKELRTIVNNAHAALFSQEK